MIEYYGDWYLTSCAAADAPSSRRNGPLEMRKVEMGNGIGCITRAGGGEGGEGRAEGGTRRKGEPGWLVARHFRQPTPPLFRRRRRLRRHLYASPSPLLRP